MKHIALLFGLALLVAGCAHHEYDHHDHHDHHDDHHGHEHGDHSEDAAEAAAANPDSKAVVASFYPLAFMAAEIAGTQLDVLNLSSAVDVHEYRPSPQDMAQLNNARLVIYQGAQLEPWVADVIPALQKAGVATLEVSAGVQLREMEEHDEHHGEHEDEQGDEHEDDEHHDEHDDHDDHEHHHDHGEFDPHTWLDPVLAQQMAQNIGDAMAAADPANAAQYRARADELAQRFAQLDERYQAELQNCQVPEAIVAHDAYGYLADRYGLALHAIAGLSTQDEPSAKILAELAQEAEHGITHVLVEDNNIREFALTLARETGLQTLPINPLGRGTSAPDQDFFGAMEANLSSFKAALGCQ